MHDLLGLNDGHVPSFAKKYAHLAETAKAAFAQYVAEVADGTFPPPRPAPGRVRPPHRRGRISGCAAVKRRICFVEGSSGWSGR